MSKPKISRRDFIRRTAGAAGATLAAPGADFDDEIIRPQAERFNDPPAETLAGKEMLAELRTPLESHAAIVTQLRHQACEAGARTCIAAGLATRIGLGGRTSSRHPRRLCRPCALTLLDPSSNVTGSRICLARVEISRANHICSVGRCAVFEDGRSGRRGRLVAQGGGRRRA